MYTFKQISIVCTFLVIAHVSGAQEKKRARDLNIPFEGTPGKYNAVTDVSGIEVGYKTLVNGSGKLEYGKGPWNY
jgi:hypothetical protein